MAGQEEHRVRDLGIPVRCVNLRGFVVGKDAAGAEALYTMMGQQADNLFVLQISPRDGSCVQHAAPRPHSDRAAASAKERPVPDSPRARLSPQLEPGSNYPTASAWGKDDRLYVGAAYSGHLLCLDPKRGALEDLGAINPPLATFPCGIGVDADGKLWIGCYGDASLTSYDPATGQFKTYGRMDEVDMYCYPQVGSDGMIACSIGVTKPHVVAFDPATGEKRTVGPVVTAGEAGESVSLQRGSDGLLYVVSSKGNFRVRGLKAEPADEVPPAAAPTLSDGSTFGFADAEQQGFRRLAINNTRSGEKREFCLDYEAAGTAIFLLHLGPDGKVYGSSVLPEHLFRYDPATDEVADFGRCSISTGEAYSMGNLDGKLYICSYPAARLSVYDPTWPCHFGEEEGDNPRDLGRMDEVSFRPRAMLTGPLERVWTGSIPDYGMWGGPLSWFDPATGRKGTCRSMLEDQSLVSLAWLEQLGLIAAGTSIYGGSGTEPRAKEAALCLWDPAGEKLVWHGSPRAGTQSITALVMGAERLLYGIAQGGEPSGGSFALLFAFDARSRSFLDSIPLPEGAPMANSLQVGPDGAVWGLTSDVLFRLDAATKKLQVVANLPGEFDIAGPMVGNTLYFATNHRLRALTLGGGPGRV